MDRNRFGIDYEGMAKNVGCKGNHKREIDKVLRHFGKEETCWEKQRQGQFSRDGGLLGCGP